MNLRKILTPVAASLLLLSTAAHARYVFVLPAAGSPSPSLQAYTESLQPMGAVTVPSGANQVLTTVNGDKAIVIAQNANAPVSFVTIAGGQLSGVARPVPNLNVPAITQASIVAKLTPDGQRLVVLGGFPATLYVIDPISEQVLTGGSFTIGASARGLVITRDSKYAIAVCSPSLFSAINLATLQYEISFGMTGVTENPSIALAPSGALYVTARDILIQYAGRPPFNEVARTSTSTGFVWPGKLEFSPDGRYGITTNETASGSSVLTYDFTVRGPNTPAGAVISQIPITFGDNIPKKMDLFAPVSDSAAIAWSAAGRRLFLVQYPLLSAADLSLAGVGVPQDVAGMSLTNEFPNPRYLYYLSNGQIFRHDLVANTAQGSTLVNPGPIVFAAVPSSAAPAVMYGYGNTLTVGPNTPTTYYVRVLDGNGRPVYNADITFTVETGSVTLTNAATKTNMDGYAYVTVTSSSANGDFRVRANCGNATVALTSSVSGGTGGGTGGGDTGGGTSTTRIIKVSGDGQLSQVMNAFTQPLIVRVVDASGKPVAGKQVTWTESGGVSFASPAIQVTDANGEAQMMWIPGGNFGPGIPYLTYTVVANTDIGNASFTLTSYPFQTGQFNPIPTVQLTKPAQDGKNLTVKLGAKYEGAVQIVIVTGGGSGVSPGLPIPGVGLSVTTGNTDPKLGPVARCEGGVVLSGQDGIAACNLIVEGKTGQTGMTVDVGGLISFTDLRLTVNPGDPIAPTILSGNNQTGKPGATLPQPLSIQVTDNFGNILPGLPVTWDVVTPNSLRLFNTISTTDYNGRSSTSVQLGSNPGKYKVRALVGGKEASFDITIETLATGFAKVSGDNQPVTPINQPFPSPLIVVVTDAQGKPVAGASVAWTITGSGSLSAIASTTGADGRAQVNVTAGATPGAITVTATTGNLPALTFTLQSRLPGPGITSASFTNFATGEAVVSPGNLILITGSGLAPNFKGTLNANLLGARLPYELAGVTVEFQFAGRSAFAPIYRVSNTDGIESVLIQAPFELTGAAVNAVVTVSGGNTTVTNIPLRSVSPGVIEDMIAGRRAAVVIRSDGLVVTPETPARRGEEVRLYAIGLGQTTPVAETNRVGQPQQAVRATVAVGVDDKGVDVIRAELSENLIGVYEIVFKIPADAIIGSNRPLGFVIQESPDQPAVYANGSVIAIGNTP